MDRYICYISHCPKHNFTALCVQKPVKQPKTVILGLFAILEGVGGLNEQNTVTLKQKTCKLNPICHGPLDSMGAVGGGGGGGKYLPKI